MAACPATAIVKLAACSVITHRPRTSTTCRHQCQWLALRRCLETSWKPPRQQHVICLPQLSNMSYRHSSCGTSLYLILVGCFARAGRTLLTYKSPTLITSYLGFSSGSTQQSKGPKSASGSMVKKKGKEYRSCPVRLRTRWTVAGNRPFECRSRYCPTLQTKVPGFGGASTQIPS